jgi:hypothetical protein
MEDYTPKDFYTQLAESISEAVIRDLTPIELPYITNYIQLIRFNSIHDLINSMFFDEHGNNVENINHSLYVKRICENEKFVTETLKNIFLKLGILANKHLAKIQNAIGIEKQASKINANIQKQILAENYMNKGVEDIELYFKNVNIIWEVERENNPNVTPPSPKNIGTLEWKGSLKVLNELSKELKAKGFTNNPTDFEKVFIKQTPTDWLKEPEYLAFLLDNLYNHSPRQFEASLGGKFKIAEKLFYDYRKKSRKEINLSNLLYNVNKRQATKQHKIRERVNILISQFIK